MFPATRCSAGGLTLTFIKAEDVLNIPDENKDIKDVRHPKSIISKMDAAYQQLETAIELFFNDGNEVSIHTLVGAAHGILHDLGKKKGIHSLIKDSDRIRPEYRKVLLDAINAHQNFFKHANKDGDKKLEFPLNITEIYLFDAIQMFLMLGGKLSHQLKIFNVWLFIEHPEFLKDEGYKKIFLGLGNEIYNSKNTAREALKRFKVEERGGIIL